MGDISHVGLKRVRDKRILGIWAIVNVLSHFYPSEMSKTGLWDIALFGGCKAKGGSLG